MEQTGCLDTYAKDIASVLDDIEKINGSCIVPSRNQTKDWRSQQKWYYGGKFNECEVYQRNIVETITQYSCTKSNIRINTETLEMRTQTNPLKKVDGFEWTEDFDGYQNTPFKIYYNLKMVCGSGGAQIRTLREVNHFIKAQLEYLLKTQSSEVLFVNILDGDESYKRKDHFSHLKKKTKYDSITKFVFVGDLYEFNDWYQDLSKDNQQSDKPDQK